MPQVRVRPVLVVALLAASAARADDAATVRLRYVLDPGTELSCPDEEMLKSAVGARLGYEPFTTEAPRVIEARVTKTKSGLVGEVRLFDVDDALVGVRRLDGEGADCMELSRALELAISIAIDPRAVLRPPPPLLPDEEGPPLPERLRKRGMPVDTTDPPPGIVTVQPVEVVRVWNTDAPLLEGPPPPPDLAMRQRRIGYEEAKAELEGASPVEATTTTATLGDRFATLPWFTLKLHAGALGVVGTAPSPTLGNHVGIGFHFKLFGVVLEYQRNLPSTGGISIQSTNHVWSDLRTISLQGCVSYDWLFGCAGMAGGLQTFAEADAFFPEQFRPSLGLVGRVGSDLPFLWFIPWLGEHLLLRLHGDLTAPFFLWQVKKPSVEGSENAKVLWVVPPVGLALGAALVVRI